MVTARRTSNFSFSRISILGLLMTLASLVIIGRLAYWQLFSQVELSETAAKQIFASESTLAQRGQIMTSDMTAVVSNQPVYELAVDFRHLKMQKADLAGTLAPITWQLPKSVIDEASQSAKLIKDESAEYQRLLSLLDSKSKYVSLSQHLVLNSEQVETITKTPGLVLIPSTYRTYTNPVPMSHVLGFVGKDNIGQEVGRYGLEGYYQRELEGRQGDMVRETDSRGRPIPLGEDRSTLQIDGRTLVTNIDRTVQFILEKELEAGLTTYDAIGATAVVMDPKTGAILGMASYPDYHPGWYEVFPPESYTNPAVGASYEPGSIFKVLVMAGGLDSGAINLGSVCPCTNSVQIGTYTISNFDNGVYPNSTLVDILKHSDNVGMVYIARQMGLKTMLNTFENFGIGRKTDIDLEEEMTPILRNEKDWKEIDVATASFGQGIAVTPIQMVSAVGAIANHGVLMKPQIVKQIIDPHRTIDIEPESVRQAIKPETAEQMSRLMTESFEFLITNHARKDLAGYRIAGKTGTAQIPIEGHYDEEKVMASFIGFAPSDDPKFVMIVALREPKSANFASQTAAPLWFTIGKQLFNYWGIQPVK